MKRLVDEFNQIPWNARGRRLGNGIQMVVAFVAIMAGPAIVLGLVNWLVP